MAAIISEAEGIQMAHDYLASLHTSFKANDMTTNRAFHGETMKWDWSGDIKGEGTTDEYYAVLENSWQLVVSNFVSSNAYPVVDTTRGIICITFDVVLIMDGHGLVPITPANTFQGRNMFELHVNADKKITMFRGIWDPLNAQMGAAFGAVLAANAAK